LTKQTHMAIRVSYLFYLIVLLLAVTGCKKKYGDSPRDLSMFERIAHERTDDETMEDFIDSLLLRMTLTDKIGQMTQISESFFSTQEVRGYGPGTPVSTLDTTKLVNTIQQYQIGSILQGGNRSAEEWVLVNNFLQRINLNNSSGKIPLVFGIDHVHGTNFISDGTVFPHQINIGATFNPSIAYSMGRSTALEAAPLGHHWNYAPLLGIGVKKNWPGLYETFGEDTHLAGVMGEQYVVGLQEARIGNYQMAACGNHFIGNSVPNSGWDRTGADISDQWLYEFLLPPFEMAIDSGVKSILVNGGAINNIPVHTSFHFLTTVLRDELDFEGVVVSGYGDIIKLNSEHFITENEKESTYKAINAGIDMVMTPLTTDFCDYLKELVEEGRIPEERIDLSVKRILRLKYELGLFDNPFPTDDYIVNIASEEIQKAARDAAAESIVLLKNTNRLLPLGNPNRLTVIGSNADSKIGLCGGWTYSWQGNDENMYPDSMLTVLGALEQEFENTRIVLSDRAHLRYYAGISDAVLVVTGEDPYAEGLGNVDDMFLPAEELELIEAAIATNKPVILILLEGRPRIIGDLFDQCHAVIFAGLPGKFGGEAISGILSGRINPSAKMSITYPYRSGHMIPYNYSHTVFNGLNAHNTELLKYTICGFGEGLSYTRFEYSNLTLSDSIITPDDKINVTVLVKNTGSREGKEAVLWYISDEVGTYSRPVKQLKHFDKQFLLPGETKEYSFTIDPIEHLSYPDESGRMMLEDGYFKLSVGVLESRFKLTSE